ncbi:hypothetical protein [Granulicella sp. S156]|jgi:hypothetical protein|uniref:hypothetical protein n=1 Tax=Granulicella sp. S156 TaxID=1747224 RepID=UPI00131AD8ED|nr:hypothetical protein [Granulicella sp. S156]
MFLIDRGHSHTFATHFFNRSGCSSGIVLLVGTSVNTKAATLLLESSLDTLQDEVLVIQGYYCQVIVIPDKRILDVHP